jgi:SWI/SNF-related matrix-associated actin-dependent regulator 1 of chromatin subfamily A
MQDSLVQLTKGNGIMANIKRCKLFNDWTNTKSDSSSNISSSVSGPSQRKLVLNQLYCHAGTAKIPLLLEMLNKFIMDPSKGKVCIFAHHLAVIEALIQQSKLSEMDCACQYIRIDGSTSPKDRQIQVIRFQSDPNVRIAILGITSAGVALTLTAASTVWFAELYWTPAMLLQSEDRCHRIGQQATVRCVYFVARGSLDELLWKLIEKKYSELGEFVEGKGNENIVINHDFLDELDAMNTWFADDGECNKLPSHPDEECGSDTTIFLGIADDEDIGRFIEELGQEENGTGDNNDDISIIEGTVGLQSPSVSLKPNAAVSVNEDLDYPQKGVVPTKGVVDVIEISDDEGDISCDKDMKLNGNATSPNSHSQVSIQSLIDRHAEYSTDDFVKEICAILPQTPLHTLRLYRFFFPQNFTLTSGLQFFCGRFMNMRRYSNSLGESCRPGVGDVVVAIQGRILQPLSHQQHATRFISIAEATFKSQQYIEIIFGEDPLFQALADILNRKRIAAV